MGALLGRHLNITLLSFAIGLGFAAPVGAKGTWEWQHPFPVGHDLNDIWGSDPTDIYAYEKAGIDKTETFIVGKHGGEEQTQALGEDYLNHVQELSKQAGCLQPFSR